MTNWRTKVWTCPIFQVSPLSSWKNNQNWIKAEGGTRVPDQQREKKTDSYLTSQVLRTRKKESELKSRGRCSVLKESNRLMIQSWLIMRRPADRWRSSSESCFKMHFQFVSRSRFRIRRSMCWRDQMIEDIKIVLKMMEMLLKICKENRWRF